MSNSSLANSTFRETVDTILTMAGQVTIGNSSGDFNSNTLDKPQQQAKQFVDFANRFLALETKGRFTKRKFQFTVDPNTVNVYGISTQTTFERLLKDSWAIVAPTAQAQPLNWKNYNLWLTQFPNGETTKGIPNFWIDLPPSKTGTDEYDIPYFGDFTGITPGNPTVISVDALQRSPGDYVLVTEVVGTIGDALNNKIFRVLEASGLDMTLEVDTTGLLYTSGGKFEPRDVDRVSFSPPPSVAVTVQYEGYLNTVALRNETDIIIWPKEFEHLLWIAGVSFLEVALSEGKAPNYQALLEPAVTQVKQLSLGPVDQIPQIDLGIELSGIPRNTIYVWNNQ